MQARLEWVLNIFGTQVTKQKRPVRPVFPDYLSVSYDYGKCHYFCITLTSDGKVTEKTDIKATIFCYHRSDQFLQTFDAFFPFYQNEAECNNEILIKVK